MRPQSGVGSTTPMLRNERPASAVTVAGTDSANVTRIGAQRFGRICRKRM
jgi:hypothetical protein